MTDSSLDLLDRWKEGDEDAAAEIFDRYVSQLIALAGQRLSAKMKRRVAAEDVVQSAYRSFFRKAGEGQFTLEDGGNLWGLLAAITINKVRGHVQFHTAGKRNIGTEASMTSHSCYGHAPETVAREPTAADATALTEAFEQVTSQLNNLQRDVFELYLQGRGADDIAKVVRRSDRTVRRTILELQRALEERIA